MIIDYTHTVGELQERFEKEEKKRRAAMLHQINFLLWELNEHEDPVFVRNYLADIVNEIRASKDLPPWDFDGMNEL